MTFLNGVAKGERQKVPHLLSDQLTETVEFRGENMDGGGGVKVGPKVAFGSTK